MMNMWSAKGQLIQRLIPFKKKKEIDITKTHVGSIFAVLYLHKVMKKHIAVSVLHATLICQPLTPSDCRYQIAMHQAITMP